MKVSRILVKEKLYKNAPYLFTETREIDISEMVEQRGDMMEALRVYHLELLKIYARASGACRTPKMLVDLRSSFMYKNVRTEISGWGSVEFACVGRLGNLITF